MLEIFRSPFLLLLSFVLCATVESFAQDPIEKEVAELVSVMRTQSRNPDSLLFYADKLLQVSNAQDYDPGRFRAYVSMGQALSRKGDVNLSNDYLHKALRISLVSENERETLGVLNNLALNHRRLRRNDSSMYYFQKIKKKYEHKSVEI